MKNKNKKENHVAQLRRITVKVVGESIPHAVQLLCGELNGGREEDPGDTLVEGGRGQ